VADAVVLDTSALFLFFDRASQVPAGESNYTIAPKLYFPIGAFRARMSQQKKGNLWV
jgi:hypothetical protein